MFCGTYGNQCVRIRLKNQKAYKNDCMKSSLNIAASIMVWAYVASNDPKRLCIVHEIIVFKIYEEILEHFMTPSSGELCGNDLILRHF